MILTETVFHRGQPVGLMHRNSLTGRVSFQPVAGHTRLARRRWKSAKACQRAVLKSYQQGQAND